MSPSKLRFFDFSDPQKMFTGQALNGKGKGKVNDFPSKVIFLRVKVVRMEFEVSSCIVIVSF
jgi:hypothetical protein